MDALFRVNPEKGLLTVNREKDWNRMTLGIV
jgi:hypothetical protein